MTQPDSFTTASYEVEFKLKGIPFITRTDTTTVEILECLKTGLFRNQPVESISLFSIASDDGEQSHTFVYNMEAAKSGNQPWSIKCQAT